MGISNSRSLLCTAALELRCQRQGLEPEVYLGSFALWEVVAYWLLIVAGLAAVAPSQQWWWLLFLHPIPISAWEWCCTVLTLSYIIGGNYNPHKIIWVSKFIAWTLHQSSQMHADLSSFQVLRHNHIVTEGSGKNDCICGSSSLIMPHLVLPIFLSF